MKLRNTGGNDRLLALAGAVLSAADVVAGVIALSNPTSLANNTYYLFLGSIGFIVLRRLATRAE